MTSFFQDPPVLGNQFTDDDALQSVLRRLLPAGVLAEITPDLVRFGQRVVEDIVPLAEDAERNQPRLVQYDPWGRRIDRIDVARGWSELERVSAQEGLVAIGYERQQGPWSRLYQFTKLYLFNPSSSVYTCPLAMADGAARALELFADERLMQRAYRRLTTRDPDQFWTSGQWMTERTGGSDVSGTSTIARADGAGYRLTGTKWFTSSTTSQMAMTLARIEDAAGRTISGSRGLSLFYLETRDAAGELNGIRILRLKDKLGTKALPTAELELDGTTARLVGQPGQGVRNIAALMNITRLYNSICAVSSMRRCLALMRDYAGRREVFGKPLAQQPLHLETLAGMDVEFRAGLLLTLRSLELLGKEECVQASDDESAVLRILTPLTKLYTAKQTVAIASETLESFGGAGYVEDTGLPKILRDAQVLSIWEGTTNVLSLDTLRAIDHAQAFEPWLADVRRRLETIRLPALNEARLRAQAALDRIAGYLPQAVVEGLEFLQGGARQLAYSMARTYAASLLLEQAQWSMAEEQDCRWQAAAIRWCRQELAPLVAADDEHRAISAALALGAALPVESKLEKGATMGHAVRS